MKAEAIRKLLKGVIDDFTEKHSPIKEFIINDSFITGGCIPSMIMDEFVNDYDLYFKHEESAKIVLQYFETLKNYKGKYKVNLITENSINLSDKIQIVIRYNGYPDELTSKFDWAHIKSYYDIKEDKLIIVPDTYRLCIEKELVYTGSDYPLSSLFRTRKFIKKGWTVSAKTILHIIFDIMNKFNMYSHKDLIEFGEYVYSYSQNEDTLEQIHNVLKNNTISNLYEDHDIKFSIDTLIEQMNGVDPLTIQARLKERIGEYLSVNEIINLIDE